MDSTHLSYSGQINIILEYLKNKKIKVLQKN